ncbi:MAG: ImmA/IrrE family metallo-endopeptidase [Candidatus Eisenbacteria bacterium]
MGRVRARIKPELLVWARDSIGLSPEQAAKKIGVKLERLSQWEAGEGSPTIPQLRTVAGVYKRPLAVFYLPAPPRDFDALKDFRRLPGQVHTEYSPELNLAIRRAHMRREIALELYQDLGEAPPQAPRISRYRGGSDDLAVKGRHFLGVGLQEQFGWRDKYKALSGWVSAMENNGVLVFHARDIDLGEMRAFSIDLRPLPVVVLNASDAHLGRVFSLMHEFCHILQGTGGLCDFHENPSDHSTEQQAEVFCNQFAASLLVPGDAFLREEAVVRTRDAESWTDSEIRQLANKYSVSSEVILRRLLTVGKTTQRFYEGKRNQLLESYRRLGEREQSGFPPFHRVVVRDLGKAYVRLVLEAYYREAIHSGDLSDYLGVNLKHIPDIEHDLV